jgi:hypothetical protein
MLTQHPSQTILDGRWLEPQDEGELHAIICFSQQLPKGVTTPKVGESIVIEVPKVIYRDGNPVFLETDTVSYTFSVVGRVMASTRIISEALQYWALPEIQVPLSTFLKIWQEIGGGEYRHEQVSLGYSELNYLEDVVYELRRSLPQFSFYSFAEHFQQAERRGLIEVPNPTNQAQVITSHTQAPMLLDFRLPFTLMIFINAALVVASNLLIMVSERKREIAILKAVGMENKQVMGMILTEGLLISMVGVGFGFIFFRVPATLQEMTNHLSGFTILKNILSEGLAISAVTSVFTIVFGILPGFMTARLPVMEVLRKD